MSVRLFAGVFLDEEWLAGLRAARAQLLLNEPALTSLVAGVTVGACLELASAWPLMFETWVLDMLR